MIHQSTEKKPAGIGKTVMPDEPITDVNVWFYYIKYLNFIYGK